MGKYAQLASILETRIHRGDYIIRDLPTEQALAEELGASRMTARRVYLHLLEKGVLVRKPHGRLEVNHQHANLSGRLRLAFLSMAFSSPNAEAWRFAVHRAAKKVGAVVRSVDFEHWDEPVIPETLAGFDGVFLLPSSETIPLSLLERFGRAQHLVSLDNDLSQWGVPSVDLLPPRFMHCLGDHLYRLGHRHIDCLNTQPDDRVIQRRAEQWLLWQRMHKVEGRLISEPVAYYEDPAPKAYEVTKRRVESREFEATALVCLTGASAVGAVRALQDCGIAVGKDVSVCATEGGWHSRFRWPSTTVLDTPKPDIYVETCVDWFAMRTKPWVGPLLMEPSTPSLFEGESTGPAPKRVRSDRRK